MIISIKIIFLIIILYSISNCKELAKKEKYLIYEEEYLINSQYYFAENHNFENNNYSQYNETNDNNTSINEAISNFPASYLTYIIKGFLPKLKNQGEQIFEQIKNTSCFQYYFSTAQKDLQKIIKYSGKSYPDFGDEEGCIREKMLFILFCISFKISNSSNYEGKFPLLPFISNGYSFYGLCIHNESKCLSLQEELKSFINNDISIKDIYHLETFINIDSEESKKEIEKKTIKFTIFNILFFFFVIYFAIRIIISIIGMRFFKEKEKIGNSSSSSSDEEEEEEEEEEIQVKKKNKNKNKNNKSNINNVEKAENSKLLIEKNDIVNNISNKQKYKLFYFVYRFCSFKHAYENLFKYKGYLFNENDLYIILFFRAFSFICKTCYMNLISIVFTPSKEINNTNFFDTLFMAIVKYTSFSDIIFILAESIIMSYKLMSFIRKYTEKGKEPSFKLFINFFLRIIPSFITSFNIFFSFYFFAREQMLLSVPDDIYKRTRLQLFLHNIIDCQSCVNNKYNLIPFYMQYQNFKENSSLNKECFQFMIIMMNMFYCYLIVLIITYLSFRIKSKIYDYLITFLFLINYLLPNNLSCRSILDINSCINIKLLLGETCSTHFPHLFINYYFLGFLIGLALFYNNDITHENSLQNSSIYKPFHFLQDIIGFIYLRSNKVNLLICIITIIFQVLLSFSFFFYTERSLVQKIEKELDEIDNFIYLNEKSVFAIMFGLMLITLYTFKNESVLKGFCNNIFIVVLNRIGYGYYSLIETFINHLYSFAELEIQLNPVNILFILYGIIFFLVLNNLFLVVLYEIPAKILTKQILQLKSEQNNKDKII